MAPACIPFRLMDWIAEHRADFKKPVGNKVIWEDTEFIAFVSGANSRNDFHVNPGDEIFFQLEGDIRVDLIDERGERVLNPVREGEVLLIPAGVPHAPRRPEGTWGLIVERRRKPGELDGFEWHCETCNEKLHEVRFQLEDIVVQFAKMLRDFDADVQARTCKRCGDVLEVYGEFTMDSQIPASARR
jgi:3-hydroxyanthranilate 3,4-dioxygenase